MVVVGEYAPVKKKNARNIKVLDLEDLQNIINALKRGNIEKAKKIVS
jgi:hypothetical protein